MSTGWCAGRGSAVPPALAYNRRRGRRDDARSIHVPLQRHRRRSRRSAPQPTSSSPSCDLVCGECAPASAGATEQMPYRAGITSRFALSRCVITTNYVGTPASGARALQPLNNSWRTSVDRCCQSHARTSRPITPATACYAGFGAETTPSPTLPASTARELSPAGWGWTDSDWLTALPGCCAAGDDLTPPGARRAVPCVVGGPA